MEFVMGYKRMKKKEIRVNKKFREGNKILAKMGIKMGVNGLLFSNGIAYELKKADDEGRLMWFESPNAEGYLDM
jgi:hypothetical protein